MKKLNPVKLELIGSGASLFTSIFLFYAIDPLTHGRSLLGRLLKIAVYCLVVLGFNLWMRATNRLKGKDPESDDCMKEHIKMSMFILAMFALMELPLMLAVI